MKIYLNQNNTFNLNYELTSFILKMFLKINLFFTLNAKLLLLLLLMRAHARVAHRSGHGLAPAQGVPARGVPRVPPSWKSQLPAMTINSLQPGHGRSHSGSSPGWTDLL